MTPAATPPRPTKREDLQRHDLLPVGRTARNNGNKPRARRERHIDGHLARPAQPSPARSGPGTKRPSPTRPDGLRARVVLALWAELGAQH
jgi:hypothetical protein